jgi:peptidyl-prolyl cis-trans isomerase SurA
MIMPFEDAAYSLKTGEISMPVRSPYGYHIIKVTDKRPSRGKIKVAHIMKAAPPGTADPGIRKSEEEINEIYRKLKEGSPFGELAKKFSDHKESAVKGGELDWFGAGEVISDFSEAAFSLADTGDYTKPVRTIYGWHIIKLLGKKPPGSFEESRSYLESKINQSYLNSISRKSFVEKLKTEYRFIINQDAHKWFIDNTDTLIIQGLKKYDRIIIPEGNLYSFADKGLTTKEFADYIEGRGPVIITKDSVTFVNLSIEARASDDLLNYENSILEKKYPEFRFLMNEFHDGLLLFEISGKKVWNRVTQDTLGLRNYYEANKNSYLSPGRIEAEIYSLKTNGGEKLLASAYKKYSGVADADDLLMKRFNKKNDTLLIIKKGSWHSGEDPEIDKIKWVAGSQFFYKDGFPSIINISKVIGPEPKKFEEVHGEIMTGYQDWLDREWIKQLKGKYTVKIDSLVFEEVRKQLKNE